MTGSIQRALEETSRRRQKQIEFNEQHGITPRGIQKAIADIMEGAHSEASRDKKAKVADVRGSYESLTPEQAVRRIKKLEQEMYKHARNLEFEEAARLRDEIQKLRQVELGLTGKKVG